MMKGEFPAFTVDNVIRKTRYFNRMMAYGILFSIAAVWNVIACDIKCYEIV